MLFLISLHIYSLYYTVFKKYILLPLLVCPFRNFQVNKVPAKTGSSDIVVKYTCKNKAVWTNPADICWQFFYYKYTLYDDLIVYS